MSEIEYIRLTKCSDCGETMPRIGIHRCSPTYRQLKAHIKLHAGDCCSLGNESDMFRERCDELEESLARSGALLADTEAKLDKAMADLRYHKTMGSAIGDLFKKDEDRIDELEAKIKRLSSKGIETMHFEISELKAKLLASQKEANDLRVRVEGLLLEMEGR